LLRGFARTAPSLIDDAVAYAGTVVVPESEMFPPELHNKFMGLMLLGLIDGDADAAAAAWAPILDAVPAPALEMVMPMPFNMAQTMQDEDMPRGRQNYWKAGNMDGLSDEAIDVFVKHAPTATSPYCQPGFFGLGGAMARVAESDTAYCGRSAVFNFSIDNIWVDPAENETQIAWSRAFYDEMTPHLSDSLYLNFASEETPERVRRSYGPNYDRLVELKRTYDPNNLFRLNQNIQP
jgi:FAD/FMN-containing dehydrogenase